MYIKEYSCYISVRDICPHLALPIDHIGQVYKIKCAFVSVFLVFSLIG